MKGFLKKYKKIILITLILIMVGLGFCLFFYNKNYECFYEEFLVCPNTEHGVADTGYFKDGNKIYYQNVGDVLATPRKVKGVDLKTFKVYRTDCLKDHCHNTSEYAKDKKNVYYWGEKIKGADLETFKPFENYYDNAIDKNNCYRKGDVVDMSECEKLESQN